MRGPLHPVLAKQLYECSSKELMTRATKSAVWAEGPKVVTAYNASRGFKSVLEKIWRISYEFGYCVALKRF
ncbi:hypothetical protein B296_00044543 [Ensete ventricosum]|uniref:Uncharacterized protein n=1 Tax=Ensete ventricosum TaxID=4639 RepID=A0A426XSC8_ENSVE|nr:hypothetical protein B296_00044543 [Ensete ventricosum]